MKKIGITLILSIIFFMSFGQPQMKPNTGLIVGMVMDFEETPLQYVNVVLHKQADSTVIDAVATGEDGKFMFQDVSYSEYYLEFKFLGFENKQITKINVDETNKFVKIGKVTLNEGAQEIDEVVITSQVSTVKYDIDKKVINVAKDIQAAGGSAVDALQNVPSVNVDIEGNVSLRGSSNFTVMVNGKPSILDANDALQQIQASNIEKIEIITNPSAKFDPDGDAGIINIITKNKSDDGFSGKIELGGDNNMGYNGNLLLNYKKNKLNLVTEFGIYDKMRPMGISQYREMNIGDEIFYMNVDGENSWGRAGMNGKFGIRYDFNDFNNLSFNAEYGKRRYYSENTSNQHLWWSDASAENWFVNTSAFDMDGIDYTFDLDYEHKFNDKGHKIRAYAQYSVWEPERTNLTTMDTTDANWETIGEGMYEERTRENRGRTRARAQVDYEFPINDNTKLEAGYVFRYLTSGADYYVESYNIYDQIWVEDLSKHNNMTLDREIHAGYVTFASKLGNIFDYKLGLRTEYTNRTVYEEVSDSSYTINRPDFFPTVHLSKQLPFDQQIQASYSRRIHRPRGWHLNPFYLYMDQYTIRTGNPGLKPEYTNSFELNYMKEFGKNYVSVEGFYRLTDNKIDRIQSVYEDKILFTSTNMNQSTQLGAELMTNLVLFKMLMLNMSGNVYQYTIDGVIEGEQVNDETITWDAKAMLMTMLPTGTGIQFGGFYRGPSISLEGKSEGMFMTYGGIRQSFFKKKLNLSLSVQDVFMTMGHRFTTETAYLYTESEFYSLRPTFSLTLNYKIGGYKDKKGSGQGGGDTEFGGEGMY